MLGKKSAAKKPSVGKGKHRHRVKRGSKKPVYPLNRFSKKNRKKNRKKNSSSKEGKRKK